MSLRHAGSIRYNIQLKSRFNPKHNIQSRSYHEKSVFLNSIIKQFLFRIFFKRENMYKLTTRQNHKKTSQGWFMSWNLEC